jgi:hypothetical protein
LHARLDEVIKLASEIEQTVEEFRLTHNARAGEFLGPAREALKTLVKMLRLLPSTQLRCLVVSALLSYELTKIPADQGALRLRFFSCVASSGQPHPAALKTMLQHLPAAVLGNAAAQQETRVLIDLLADTEASARNERSRAVRKYSAQSLELVDTIADNILQILQQDDFLALLSLISAAKMPALPADFILLRARVIASLMSQLAPADRERLFLRHLILARILPHDPAQRQVVIDQLFPVTPAPAPSSSVPSSP